MEIQYNFMAACRKPFFIKDGCNVDTLVPCGKCLDCLARRASAWSFRLMQEEKVSVSSYFITLTYDSKHVPVTRSGQLTLRKSDLQKYFKRLRFNHRGKYNGRSLKYYAVGEYGGKLKRPHYHVIMFNADIKLIDSSWSKGSVFFGSVSGASVGYTLKYITKPKRMKSYDDRDEPFSVMSKGLGRSYLVDQFGVTSKMYDWHHRDKKKRMYVNLEGGKKAAMPRYYKDLLYSNEDREMIKKLSRDEFVEQILLDLIKCDALDRHRRKDEFWKKGLYEQKLMTVDS